MRPRRFALADRHLLTVGVAGTLGAILLLMLVVFGSRGRIPESKSAPVISPELLEADVSDRDPSKRVLIGARQKAEGDPLQSLQTGRGELEFTNDEGLLAFRYRWDKSDPLETGWNRFTNPQAWIYRSENQLIHVRAEEGMFRLAENRQPQAGVLRGNVVMSLYEADGSGGAYAIDTARDLPVAEFSTTSLNFDADRLSARTDERIVARTADLVLIGSGLSLLFNETLGRIEELQIPERELIVYRAADRAAGEGRAAGGAPAILPRSATAWDSPPSGASSAAPPRASQWEDFTPYRLTLTDEVTISQGEGEELLTILGRNLVADFALQRGAGGGRLTGLPSSSLPPHRPAFEDETTQPLTGHGAGVSSLRRWALIAALPFGQTPALPEFIGANRAPAATDIHITGRGGVTLVPLDGTPGNLMNPDDLYATLDGDPVRIEFGSFYAIGADLEYSQAQAVARLRCTRDQPIEAGLPDGARLTSVFPFEYQFDEEGAGASKGILQGAGTLVGLVPPERANQPPDADDRASSSMQGLPVGFSVNWLDDFTIEFGKSEGQSGLGQIAAATFSGTVHVDDPEGYSLDSQQLRIDFKEHADARRQIIDTITATGDAVMRSAKGNVSGDELFVLFREDAKGSSFPGQMTVTGHGRVVDAGGSIEAQYIQADLVEGSLASAEALPTLFGGAAHGEEDDPRRPGGRSLAVSDLLAQGSVVLSLENDVTALADRLDVDARTDTAVLTGENVIVSDPSLKVIGRHAEISNISSKAGKRIARFLGAGTLTYFKVSENRGADKSDGDQPQPVTTPEDMREELRRRLEGGDGEGVEGKPMMPRSLEASPPSSHVETVTVEWADRLTFEEGRGLITFEGDVAAVSQPNPREIDRLDGQWMQIELTEPMPASSAPEAPMVRHLRRMTLLGRGDETARVEAKRFADDERTQRELLLAIAGEIVEYTEATELFEAIGEGWMLVVDSRGGEAKAPAASEGGVDPLASSPPANPSERDPSAAAVQFSGPGETDFSWSGKLAMQGGTGLLTIRDEVVMRHRPVDQPVIRVDCDVMTAALKSGEAISAMDLSQREGMDLTRATAEGNVFVRRLDRSIWADRLTYDVQTLLATIESFDDNYVVLESDSTGGAVQARRILWDFFTNAITVEGSRLDGPMPAIRE